MAAVMLLLICSSYTKYSKNNPNISANTYENYNMSKKYCLAHHDDKMCFLPNCRHPILLRGDIKELLQKMDAFCFNYKHSNSLYTLFKNQFSGKIAVKSGQLCDIVQFISTTKTEAWTLCPASRKRDSWRKSTKNFSWTSSKTFGWRILVDQPL